MTISVRAAKAVFEKSLNFSGVLLHSYCISFGADTVPSLLARTKYPVIKWELIIVNVPITKFVLVFRYNFSCSYSLLLLFSQYFNAAFWSDLNISNTYISIKRMRREEWKPQKEWVRRTFHEREEKFHISICTWALFWLILHFPGYCIC